MALAGYKPPVVTVEIPSSSGPVPLEVHGLGLQQILYLARDFSAELGPVFDLARSGQMSDVLGQQIILSIADQAPMLVNMVIYFGLSSPEGDAEAIDAIPIGSKIELVEAIARLTFETTGGSGKLLAIIKQAVAETQNVLSTLPRKI